MKEITWRVELLAPPAAIRYCKKCGAKRAFASSGLFRVNANQRLLDVWLIYRCADCDATWNRTLLSRVRPGSIPAEELEGFHRNDPALALRYAVDEGGLRRCGAECAAPAVAVTGEDVVPGGPVLVRLVSPLATGIKVAALLREKLGLSRSAFERLVDQGRIRETTGADLSRCKLRAEISVQMEL